MMSNAHISGAFQRPTLVDYLIVAEHETLDLSLKLYVGRLDVGLVGVAAGKVVYAELPGAEGKLAVSLLSRLPSARIMAETWAPRTPNVFAPWRELIDGSQWASSADRSQRLVQIRAELRELEAETAAESGVFSDPPAPRAAGGDEARAEKIMSELLDWAGIEAYLSGDLEQAQALIDRRERLCPGQLMCGANLERLRLRLLEDEIAASVTEVAG